MHRAMAELGVAVAESERPLVENGLNWGLILALAFCLLFWSAVILVVTVVV